MRLVRLLFRIRPKARSAFKAVATVRVPGHRNPKQIHLGYVFAGQEEIREGDKAKLLKALKSHWMQLFGSDDVGIDWYDAQDKFAKARRQFESRSS